MEARSLCASVWRGTADGHYVDYQVPWRESQTVLDVVTWIQRKRDPSLAYRFACRVGMCGSCAMTVNGAPRWTCRTHVRKVAKDGAIRIGPLENLPVIKDLSVDMSEFFDKWTRARGRFVPADPGAQDLARVPPASSVAARSGLECIGCGICYAACDVVRGRAEYLGPGALNRAWSLLNDPRDGDSERLAAVAGDAGCHACHGQQGCVQWCPRNLSPTGAIAGLKRASARALLAGKL